jgi:molecular chaperone HscA
VADGLYRSRCVDATHDALLWSRIQRQCEAAKRALSGAPQVRFLLQDALPGSAARDLDLMVRREHLLKPWAEPVARSISSATETARQSGLEPDSLPVLLIGGTTFVPQVREAVGRAFHGRNIVEDDPQTAVARGAALLAAQPERLAD